MVWTTKRQTSQTGDTSIQELLNAAPDALLVVDEARVVALVNRSAERLLGYKRRVVSANHSAFSSPRTIEMRRGRIFVLRPPPSGHAGRMTEKYWQLWAGSGTRGRSGVRYEQMQSDLNVVRIRDVVH